MRTSVVTAALHILGLTLLSTAPALGFKPNEAGHLGITTAALSPIERTVGGEILRFSEHALDEIRDANRNTDIVTFFGVAEHFDDEAFHASSQRVIDLKESVIASMLAGDREGAREDFGGALHTVQDFYSHSNWIELGQTVIEPRLGRLVFEPLPSSVQTCPGDAGTLGGDGLVSGNYTTGYFPFPDPCTGPPDGTPEGKCRHGVEFFCPEGLNKDAPDRDGFPEAHDLAVLASVDYTNQILDDVRVSNDAAAIRALMGSGEVQSGTILTLKDSVDGGDVKEFAAPVDSTVAEAVFTSSLRSLTVVRPSGAAVQAGDPGVTISDSGTGRQVTIASPEPGSWRARIAGPGKFALDVTAASPLEIDRFGFVTFSGRLGHEGLAVVTTAPKRKSTAVALAQLIGPFTNASFRLIDTKAKTLQTVQLLRGNELAGDDEFVGSLKVPNQAFRLAVSGTDAAGSPYQRIFPTLITPKK